MEPTALIPLLMSAAIQTSSLPWLNAQLSSTGVFSYFNNSATDGWSMYLGSLENSGTGGASRDSQDGYLRAALPDDSLTGYYVAPNKYHGDWRRYRELRLQLQSFGGEYYTSGYSMYGDIYIANGRKNAQLLLPRRPTSTWDTFTISLTSSDVWVLHGGAANLNDVLSNVTDFQIRAEYGVGRDYSGLDNVELLE